MSMLTHRRLDSPPLPVLQASNGPVLVHPDDRKYGSLLVGGQGSGKCLAPDCLVLLGGTLVRAEDAWERYATSAVFDGEGWWSTPVEQPLACSIDDSTGAMINAPVVRLYRQQIAEPLRRVRLSDGSELTITYRHKLRGPEQWTNDLNVGDVVCVPQVVDWPGTPVDLDLAEVLAWQIAEGCERRGKVTSARGSLSVAISQADVTVLERIRESLVAYAARHELEIGSPRITEQRTAHELLVHSAAWRDHLVSRGYDWGQLSAGKRLPDFMMRADRVAAAVFLRAFADAEGSVNLQHRTVEISTASPVMAQQLQMQLRRFGVLTSIKRKDGAATNGTGIVRSYARLLISGDSIRRFAEHIGFGVAPKQQRLSEALTAVKANANREGVLTQDILHEARALGVPYKWICSSWGYLDTLRAGPDRVEEIHSGLLAAEKRLRSGQYAAPGARGRSAIVARTAELDAIDPAAVRALADKLDRRRRAQVAYLQITEIDAVDHDGWVYDFEVAEHHNFVAGGMLAHNTAAELRMYLNDIRDPNAAVIVMDPKSELVRRCLELTPPDCGKEVYYLDLGRPLFGMSPLRMHGGTDFATEATAVAENIVAALLDINEGQIFQSSKRYLYHAVIGELTLARAENRRPQFENVYGLLLPKREDLRQAVGAACSNRPDLDQTGQFFMKELPDDLAMAGSAVAQRLDAPRNKVSQLVGIPALRRFFNHPTDLPLSRIIKGRGILLVDANMAGIGEDNAQACIHFIFRQLHSQMQRQVRLEESKRPRVALICDEGHYLVSRNVIRQIATHRAAGLDVTIGLQYFSQLGAGADSASVTEEIRKGVINLLQSRFMFRLGDPQDAEDATRIAQAVYMTMIRDDPDARGRMRVPPEAILNLPRYYCLASWIAGGGRISSFIGKTFEIPLASDVWAKYHMKNLMDRGGHYPEKMNYTYKRAVDQNNTEGLVRELMEDEGIVDDPWERPVHEMTLTETISKTTMKSGAAGSEDEFDPDTADGEFRVRTDDELDDDDDFEKHLAEMEDADDVAIVPEVVTLAAEVGSARAAETTAPESGAGPAADVILDNPFEHPTAEAEPAAEPAATVPAPAPVPDLLEIVDAVPPPVEAPVVQDPDFLPDGRIRFDVAPTVEDPKLEGSDVRRVFGNPVPARDTRFTSEMDKSQAPEAIKLLTLVDRINHVGELESVAPVTPMPRLNDGDYAILQLLDRYGLVFAPNVQDVVMPGTSTRALQKRMKKLYDAGLVARAEVGVRERSKADGTLAPAYSLTSAGMKAGQTRDPHVIHPKREFRKTEQRGIKLPHDLHGLMWLTALSALLGPEIVTNNWRTPRYTTGRYPVPQIGVGRNRHVASLADVIVPSGQAIDDLLAVRRYSQKSDEEREQIKTPFTEVAPDISIEMQIRHGRRGAEAEKRGLTFDVFVEIDRTDRPSYNEEKFVAYDAFLTAWWSTHRRYETLGTRPVVVFVCQSSKQVHQYADVADKAMTGRQFYMGSKPTEWYWPGRDHVFFCVEEDIHYGSLKALALDPKPPAVRRGLGLNESAQHQEVTLLPVPMIGAYARKQAGAPE